MDIRRTAMVGATILLVALLAACATAEPDQSPAGGAALPGTEWVLTSLTGNTPIEGTQITLSFGEGSLEGSGGCNTYGGSYTATGDSLRLNELYWTEMACLEPEGILDQEMVYLNALNTATSYRVDAGRLELYDEAGTQILVFGLQETALPDPTEITTDQKEPPVVQESGLIASLDAPESLASGAVVHVRFTLTNTLSEGLFVLKWFTPLEGLAGDIFRVEREGVELTYRGKMVKRAPPTAEDYVWLDAGGSLLTEVDLAEGYDFSQAGQYTVQFRSPRLSHTAKTSAEQAASFDELAMIQIPSNPVGVTIE
jgi:peptidyl-Lys metalloendopeptidase